MVLIYDKHLLKLWQLLTPVFVINARRQSFRFYIQVYGPIHSWCWYWPLSISSSVLQSYWFRGGISCSAQASFQHNYRPFVLARCWAYISLRSDRDECHHGNRGLVTSLRVYGTLPSFPIPYSTLPNQEERMQSLNAACRKTFASIDTRLTEQYICSRTSSAIYICRSPGTTRFLRREIKPWE